ncbi:hypothetical protein XELAEV_18039002mg [Xenopus laevis]|uniref:Uncharacterized protein n=1 Tax=Xenopus laevis TaxID=8355 RepID=A0A974H7S8_XENLA|nr:hypothetical protein XELAEV_18039002mg [Xenopus laevis]
MAAEAVMEGIRAARTGQDAERFRKELQELLAGAGSGARQTPASVKAVRRPTRRTRPPERLSPGSSDIRRSRRSPSAGRQRSPEGRQQAQGPAQSRSGTLKRAELRNQAPRRSRQVRALGRMEQGVCSTATTGSEETRQGAAAVEGAHTSQAVAQEQGPRMDSSRPMSLSPGRALETREGEGPRQGVRRRSPSRGSPGEGSKDSRRARRASCGRPDCRAPERRRQSRPSSTERWNRLSRSRTREDSRDRSRRTWENERYGAARERRGGQEQPRPRTGTGGGNRGRCDGCCRCTSPHRLRSREHQLSNSAIDS